MFTTKPEAGEKIAKLGGGDAKSPFTGRLYILNHGDRRSRTLILRCWRQGEVHK